MRIALDARCLYAPTQRGIGRTLLGLYRALAKVRPTWQVVAYHQNAQSGEVPGEHPLPSFATPRHIDMPGDRLDAWMNIRLPLAAWHDRADVLHCPANLCPAWSAVPLAVTIHDLIPLDMPANYPRRDVRRFARSMRTAAQRAEIITCPSPYTAERFRQGYHPCGPVEVIPWAMEKHLSPSVAAVDHVRQTYHLAKPYVLHFGAGDPRKNTHRLLKAWSQLPAGTLKNWRLVVVGLDEETLGDLHQWTQKRKLEDAIALYPFVDAAHVQVLLADAALLAYPSLSEGFGMPILEAFAAGTAVLAGDRTALPEVAGDAAELVDPTDADAITAAIARLLEYPRLRTDLAQRGSRRVEQFSWSAAAEKFAQGLETAVEEPARRPGLAPAMPS